MLGVATLIVVNSVMGGFSAKLRDRLHALISDVVIEAWDPLTGISHPEQKMAMIQDDPFLRDRVVAMTPVLEIFAVVEIDLEGGSFMKPVRLIGVDPKGRAELGGFAEYLLRPDNKINPSFELDPEAKRRYDFRHRNAAIPFRHFNPRPDFGGMELAEPPLPVKPPPDMPEEWNKPAPPRGIILGYALAHMRDREQPPDAPPKDIRLVHPGDSVRIVTVGGGEQPRPVTYNYVVCDYFKSEMSEYDGSCVFVSYDFLQQLRTMQDRASSIQLRLKDYHQSEEVVKRLKVLFENQRVDVLTWEQKQGPVLAAIDVERGLLNVLLFMIIAVAGFGILAIFSMIVVEKTRDIGVLKALGASNGGVLKIFLGYGLLLGIVGAACGTGLGVAITVYINQIEKFVSHVTGTAIFPRDVYYFADIPTDIRAAQILMIDLGAIGIAVLSSILPSLRAALLHPVRALRYE
jgi:lipoprotein-releasing system permease protein